MLLAERLCKIAVMKELSDLKTVTTRLLHQQQPVCTATGWLLLEDSIQKQWFRCALNEQPAVMKMLSDRE